MKNTILPLLCLSAVVATAPVAAAEKSPTCRALPGTGATAKRHAAPPVVCGQLRTSKSRLGVKIDYTVSAPDANGASVVQMSVSRDATGQPLNLQVWPDNGLPMPSGLPGGKAEQATGAASYTMTVVPRTGGALQYVNVLLRSGNMTEALAIPVQSSKGVVLAKPVAVKQMPSGERVIAIPAQER